MVLLVFHCVGVPQPFEEYKSRLADLDQRIYLAELYLVVTLVILTVASTTYILPFSLTFPQLNTFQLRPFKS